MANKIGRQSYILKSKPSICGYSAVVGKTEGQGPLAEDFDYIFDDDSINGSASFEKAESALQREAVTRAVTKSGLNFNDVDIIMGGDLLNQCIGTTFGIKELNMPFIGLYGACSTMALSLGIASTFIDAGAMKNAVVTTSSHFASAERQFRMPLEYGGQRTPTAQRTATAAGASLLSPHKKNMPSIAAVIFGKIIDLDIKDANNMGAAMAPACADTISQFLNDTGSAPSDYDLILTGDLGKVGKELLIELLKKDSNIDISAVHDDCGLLMYDMEKQDVHAGGSGCGCSGAVLNSHIIKRMLNGELKRVLFVGTGALLSATSSLQGDSIPGIAHGVLVTMEE